MKGGASKGAEIYICLFYNFLFIFSASTAVITQGQ